MFADATEMNGNVCYGLVKSDAAIFILENIHIAHRSVLRQPAKVLTATVVTDTTSAV